MSLKGDRVWEYDELHKIDDDTNTLVIGYKDADDNDQTVSISVDNGYYTTQELIDEIDSALEECGALGDGVNFEFTDEGKCIVNVEGGTAVNTVSGGLSYLLSDSSNGGNMGMLIGTTSFPNENSRLRINDSNNNMSFTIQNVSGGESSVSLTLDNGSYTKSEIIDKLNEALKGTSVKAVSYENSIKLYSDDALITGFKGNMFKLDNNTSVFYDNVKYGTVTRTKASLTGGAVLTTDSQDTDCLFYDIDDSNNQLTVQANGAASPVTLTIANGRYSSEEMANELNSLFSGNSIDLTAESYESNGYKGLKITSDIAGTDSDVGIDENSSAYDTLFVDCKSCTKARTSTMYSTSGNSAAYRISSKSYTISASDPLTITAGNNDSFLLNLSYHDGSKESYTISLAAGDYTSVANVMNAINEGLKNAKDSSGNTADISESVYCTTYGSRLEFVSKKSSDIQIISYSGLEGNDGYRDILCSYSSYSTSVSGYSGSITLNAAVGDTMNIPSGKSNFTVYSGTGNKSVTLPTGSDVTRQDVIDALNAALTEEEYQTPYKSYTYSYGSQPSVSVSDVGSGSDKTTSYSDTGYTTEVQGNVGVLDENEAAQVTLSQSVNPTTVIDSSNNGLSITVNGVNKTITLDSGSYTRKELVAQLQSKLDAVYGSGYGGVIVGLSSSDALTFTARLGESGEEARGENTSLAMGTAGSSFLQDVEADKSSASIKTTSAMATAITLYDTADYSNNSFSFDYTNNGVKSTVSVTIPAGSYSRSGLVNAINNELDKQGVEVTASVDASNYLTFTTDNKGSGYGLSFITNNKDNRKFWAAVSAGSSTRPSTYLAMNMQDSITLDDSNNKMTVRVNGADKELTIAAGTYDKAGFINALNDALDNAGVLATASIYSTNYLRLTSDVYGSDASVSIPESGISQIRDALFGKKTFEPVTASFDTDGHLVLTSGGTDNKYLFVSSNSGSIFQVADEKLVDTYINSSSGSGRSYIITNKALASPITIDEFNKDLSFTYYDGGKKQNISVALDEGTYTAEDLAAALAQKMEDASTDSKRDFNVYIDSSGRLSVGTYNYGNSYYISDLSGGFYDRVLNTMTESTTEKAATVSTGGQSFDPAFAVGRNDIRNNIVEIKTNVNDELSLDYTVDGVTTTLSMTLDGGEYTGDDLVKEIQEKLNNALTENGLPENLITASVGGVSTGVYGSNDSNALVFKMTADESTLTGDEYIIDGISGSAAFSIFYQTDGDISVAYIRGSRDLSGGVTIDDTTGNTLSFDFDGNNIEISIANGEYTGDEFIDAVNSQLAGQTDKLHAELSDGKLKFYAGEFGEHHISNVSGDLLSTVFYETESDVDGNDKFTIQLSDERDDTEDICKEIVSTAALGINSATVSTEKGALKAMDRVQSAIDKVSAIRSRYGAKQNALERAVNNNKNTSENTQAAESRLRDEDIADGMVELSMAQIVQQASQAILANEIQDRSLVLKLLG